MSGKFRNEVFMAANHLIYNDLGRIEFQEAWKYQEKLLRQIQELKRINRELPHCEQVSNYNFLLFCEHPHVFTLGKSGMEKNLLVDEQVLKQRGATFFKVDRGGDITYHGPGQIVGYPILDLEAFQIGIKQYIHNLEEAVIKTLREFNLEAGRLEHATGVWLDPGIPGKSRKICAIGVRVSRQVTMHGFAFNVNTDLDYYRLINPCGFTDKGVTSMAKELGREIEITEVKKSLKDQLAHIFEFRYTDPLTETSPV